MSDWINVFTIVGKRISHNRFLYGVILLFVGGMTFFMNCYLSTVRYDINIVSFMENTGLDQQFMYVSHPSKWVYTQNNLVAEAEEYVNRELQDAKQKGIIDAFYPIVEVDMPFQEDVDVRALVCFLDYELLSQLSLPMFQGKGLQDYVPAGAAGEPVPIVIGYDLGQIFRVGDRVHLGNRNQEFIVTGILKKNSYFLDSNISGTGFSLNSILQNANNMVIAAENRQYSGVGNSYIVKLHGRDSRQAEEYIFGRLSDVVNTFSFRELSERAVQDNQLAIQMHGVLAVLALLTCIVGIECFDVLTFVRNRRRMAVYHMCGIDRRMNLKVCLADGIIRFFLPTILGLVVFFSFCEKQQYCGFYADWLNSVISVLLVAVVFAGSVGNTLAIGRKGEELSILNRE